MSAALNTMLPVSGHVIMQQCQVIAFFSSRHSWADILGAQTKYPADLQPMEPVSLRKRKLPTLVVL